MAMARSIRIEHPGVLNHVMAPGNRREPNAMPKKLKTWINLSQIVA